MASSLRFLLWSDRSIYQNKLIHSLGRYTVLHVPRLQYHFILNKCVVSCFQVKPVTSADRCLNKVTYNGQILQCDVKHMVHFKSLSRSTEEENKVRSLEEELKAKNDFIKMLYTPERDNKHLGSMIISKNEYYKEVWMRKASSENSRYDALHEETDIDKSDDNVSEDKGDTALALPENTFGRLNEKYKGRLEFRNHNERMEKLFDDDAVEDRDWRKNIPLSKYGRRSKPAYFYTKKIKLLASQGKIKEAVTVLDNWMMIQDRVRPNKSTYITLMIYLAKSGYTRKCFQLYRQMKQLGLDPTDQVYSILFRSCENCPMPDYGLNRASKLYLHMKDAGIEPSVQTVKSAMRAFARCGDFAKTFQILDEKTYPLDVEFFDALFMACISDRTAGFKRALQVWMLMGEYNVKPEGSTYNLLARCARDSGIGEPSAFASDLALNSGKLEQLDCLQIETFDAKDGTNVFLDFAKIKKAQQQYLPLNSDDKKLSLTQASGNMSKQTSVFNETVVSDIHKDRNISLAPVLDSLESDRQETDSATGDKTMMSRTANAIEQNSLSSDMENPTLMQNSTNVEHSSHVDKLVDVKSEVACLNERESISPLSTTEKTFPVQLSALKSPSGRLALLGGMETFLSHMRKNGKDPDIKTFTLLLSSLPNDKENEQKILSVMESLSISPEIDFLNDVMMRRNLRKEGNTLEEILQLISSLRLTPNMRTYAALAMSCHKEKAGLTLLEDMKTANLEPNIVIFGHLVFASKLNFKYKLQLLQAMEDLNLKPDRAFIKALEKNISKAKQNIVLAEKKRGPDWYLSSSYQKSFRDFLTFYRQWLKRTQIHVPRHPWDVLEEISAEWKKDNDLINRSDNV